MTDPELTVIIVACTKVRKIRGKGGVIKEQYDLIVNIDLVAQTTKSLVQWWGIFEKGHPDQDVWQLSKEIVADLKEVFMLFDKDEDLSHSKCYELALSTPLLQLLCHSHSCTLSNSCSQHISLAN